MCINTYSWKASKNRGSSKPLEPPGYGHDTSIMINFLLNLKQVQKHMCNQLALCMYIWYCSQGTIYSYTQIKIKHTNHLIIMKDNTSQLLLHRYLCTYVCMYNIGTQQINLNRIETNLRGVNIQANTPDLPSRLNINQACDPQER